MTLDKRLNPPSDFQATREGDTLERAQYYVNQVDFPERGRVSDGYHSFDDLYNHRIHIYIALAKAQAADPSGPEVWRSEKNAEGDKWEGWFLLGIGTRPGEQITYHLPMKYWDLCTFAQAIESPLFYDKHTSEDVLKRLLSL